MTNQILIVDDSSVIRTVCRSVLEEAGYQCVEAWDAAQARSRPKDLGIGFAICDLNLPGLSGLDLVEAIRTYPSLAALPPALPVAIMTDEWNLELTNARSAQA
jgi:two-component system chemotaxis response regulator CheY